MQSEPAWSSGHGSHEAVAHPVAVDDTDTQAPPHAFVPTGHAASGVESTLGPASLAGAAPASSRYALESDSPEGASNEQAAAPATSHAPTAHANVKDPRANASS